MPAAMPELPEVETVCRGLAAAIVGRRLAGVIYRRPDLRFPLPPDLPKRLAGQPVLSVQRRAKYGLWHMANGAVMLFHLGMSGRLTIGDGRDPPHPHDHVEFRFEDGVVVRFRDPRRFGFLDLADAASLHRHPRLMALGPEPLSEAFTPAVLDQALAGRHSPIKAALLDQRIVAGLGNIYVCEALFRAGISPKRRAASVPGKRAARLVPAIKAVLTEAIAAGGSSLRDYVQSSGDLGYFQTRFAVYDRAGLPCPGCDCGRPDGIQRIVQAGRSTFYCARRQR